MTNLTFTDIKEVSTSSEKLYSTRSDASAVESNGFLKIFEKANKDTNFTYEQTQSFSNNSFDTNNSAYSLNNNVNDTVKTDNLSVINNQNNDSLTAKKQNSDIKTTSQDQDKNSLGNKSDKTVAGKKEEKVNETKSTEKSQKKDSKVSDKKEVKSGEAKDLIESRIQLAALMHANIKVPKVTDSKNNDSKSSQNNNVTSKDAGKMSQNTMETRKNTKNSQFKITNTDFQLTQNYALSKTGNNQNNSLKSLKDNNTSDKKVKNTQNLQENKKAENKTTDDTLKDNKKIDVLVQNNHPEINTDNLKQGNTQLSSSTQKDLNDIFHKNGAAKPIITKLEVSDNTNNAASNQKQKQNLMNEQSATLTAPHIQTTNTANAGIEKAVTFDKVMNAKLDSKIDAESVLNQVSQKLSGEIQNGKSEITMSLRPEGLGKVDINVISEKGVIAAQIITENAQVKDILSNDIDSLKQKLLDHGVNFDSVAVKVQEPTKANNDNSNFDQDLRKFSQPDQNASNSSDFNSGKHAQDKAEQKNLNYDMSDLQSELDLKTELNSSEIHQGLVDYRI